MFWFWTLNPWTASEPPLRRGHTGADRRYALDVCNVLSPLKCIFPFVLHSFVRPHWFGLRRMYPLDVARISQCLRLRSIQQIFPSFSHGFKYLNESSHLNPNFSLITSHFRLLLVLVCPKQHETRFFIHRKRISCVTSQQVAIEITLLGITINIHLRSTQHVRREGRSLK